MKLPIYIITRKDNPKGYLRDSSGQPFQSHSKKLMELVLEDVGSLQNIQDFEVRLIEEVEC